jgi:glycosyltransferase involved in cell wall biosynthesis
MKISAFTCTLNPEYWCFPYQEALRCYLDCFDEVVVVDGGSTDGSLEKIKTISDKIKIVHLPWPWNYEQREYSLHYNFGFDNCTGDWAFKLDCDWIFHETDFAAMRTALEWRNEDKSVMAINMPKLSMLNRNEFHRKGKMVNGIHMKYYRGKIKSGVDINNPRKSDWLDCS